ncbi:type II toxin-antitoxin system VapC family toxin [uncultured Thiohalocapsa sp.]|uniref:type II toxin-antitoxin system VapC family toxin n=1 Tax=uncultured Thiohalocapsa sp. TaxID=768990 RepID=UPI0025F34A7C|nr:type II toxin-antitoxin system VapC family toxin [uncultured Thiohalocapsa sp.]
MARPTVYIETSFVSVLTARPSRDLMAAANQAASAEWWDKRRGAFDLVVSEFVVAEAERGNPDAARRRLDLIAGLPSLRTDAQAASLQAALIADGAMPESASVDAFHIALAAVNGMNYILTWNCRHIANAAMRPHIERVCRDHGFEPPVICTPIELMEE